MAASKPFVAFFIGSTAEFLTAVRDIVLQQIDLEISMKTMFIEATEARINWATHLQDAVAAPPAPGIRDALYL